MRDRYSLLWLDCLAFPNFLNPDLDTSFGDLHTFDLAEIKIAFFYRLCTMCLYDERAQCGVNVKGACIYPGYHTVR